MKAIGSKHSWAWALLLAVVGAIWMVPLVFMISMSFRPTEMAFEPVLFVSPVVLSNYKKVLEQSTLINNFASSLVVTISTVALVGLFASMTTFGLTRKEVRAKRLIYNLLMITLMVPISALVIPMSQTNSALGWLNKFQGLILPYTALGIPFAVVVLKGFMDGFPPDLEDAATVDGCGDWRLFFQIVLPILRPGLIVVAIWQFLTSWNEFFLALVTISDVKLKTLPLVPMQYQGFNFSQPGALFAILVIITVPTIVFYALVQKYFVKGMMSGAVKG